ncbi:MAG: Maf family protein [Treponema sp.]|nr:Maf family protein [Treponema sp.]
MEEIILASASLQRREFLRLLGLPFTCVPSPLQEIVAPHEDARAAAERLAVQKVNAVVPLAAHARWVFAADTLVSLGGEIFGKPADRNDAARMLRALGGRTHEVVSAAALYSGAANAIDCRSVSSAVTFAPLSPGEIEWYLDSGEWQGAAGAYKIQGLASCFVVSITGSFSSIVGLPLREFYDMLRDNGYPYGG